MGEQQSAASGSAGRDEQTGMTSVDDVLDQVARLSESPVSEHVAVFERAHEQLRRALDARPDS